MLVQRVNQLLLQTAHTIPLIRLILEDHLNLVTLSMTLSLLSVHIHIPRGLRTREGVFERLVPQQHYPQHILSMYISVVTVICL